jgi:hypothetical protein
MADLTNNIIFLGFADNKVPEFKEVKSREWILCGSDNKFPYQLLYLFDKSSNHNAIINGKVQYIIGKGLPETPELKSVNRFGESFKKILIKACADIELFGGFYFNVVWKMGGKPEIYHVPFQKVRLGKNGGYFYAEDWRLYNPDPTYIGEFNVNDKKGSQLFFYKEYRPGCEYYPLPGYFGALNDIETDVEISKYNLSIIKNGMFSSKMIVFNNGEPTKEVKAKIEKDFKNKFAGSENSGNFMLVFNTDPAKAPIVNDLSTSDLDKLFDQLNKTTQAEIFSAHLVTSPLLFGIAQPGSLGNRNEIQDAYEIFKNTYVQTKQENLNEVINIFLPLLGVNQVLQLQEVDPIGFKPNDDAITAALTKNELREFAGLDPIEGGEVLPDIQPNNPSVNENIKNLSGRQNQQLLRVIRQYERGKLSREQAATLLRTSLALGDEEIDVLLKKEEFEKDFTEFEVAEMFSEIGEKKESFHIVKSKPYGFDAFADIKQTDSNILNLISKDKRMTPQVIGKTLGLEPAYVSARIKTMEENGVLTRVTQTIGVDTIIEHSINREQIDKIAKPEVVDVYVKYSYEAKPGLKPVIDTTRPFCKRLIELDRLYTRAEIESISQRVGYSVFDRKGGFWGSKEECRHRWVSNIVIKKKS